MAKIDFIRCLRFGEVDAVAPDGTLRVALRACLTLDFECSKEASAAIRHFEQTGELLGDTKYILTVKAQK